MRKLNSPVYLPKDSGTVRTEQDIRVNRVIEGKFSPWKHAHCGIWILRRAKTASAGAEIATYKLVGDLGRTRANTLQTVIAHRVIS
jgi:hypothetical protein